MFVCCVLSDRGLCEESYRLWRVVAITKPRGTRNP
jgi:hypothetical protein